MGTHLRVLDESYPVNTNMTGLRGFSKVFAFLCLGRNSLSIGRVKHTEMLKHATMSSIKKSLDPGL